LYEDGHGVPQDYAAAAAWYRRAAEQGSVGAQYRIGRLYQYGLGVPKDYAQAMAWYREAAEVRGVELGKDAARERIYGEPFAQWKSKHQPEATPEQLAAFAEAQRRHT
jgi:TPR repeat protein